MVMGKGQVTIPKKRSITAACSESFLGVRDGSTATH